MIAQFPQHVLEPAGREAARHLPLWWFMIIVSTTVYVIVIATLLYATLRRRQEPAADEATPERHRRAARGIIGATAVTVVLLLVFLVFDFTTHRALAAMPVAPLEVHVSGRQWWWHIEYPDTVPQRRVTTANEIHIPVGRPVLLKLTSPDVIHSFWAPNLNGKKDLVPGHENALVIQADRPGKFRAQCAEFCGHQHAKMALWVVAEPPAEFEAWLDAQRRPATPPTDSLARLGQQVFLTRTCVMCHAIGGTPAGSRFGPDLTHLASRLTIAAGTLPNTPGHLAGWITDPQRIKPGVRMPPNPLPPGELQALLAYLETLR